MEKLVTSETGLRSGPEPLYTSFVSDEQAASLLLELTFEDCGQVAGGGAVVTPNVRYSTCLGMNGCEVRRLPD